MTEEGQEEGQEGQEEGQEGQEEKNAFLLPESPPSSFQQSPCSLFCWAPIQVLAVARNDIR